MPVIFPVIVSDVHPTGVPTSSGMIIAAYRLVFSSIFNVDKFVHLVDTDNNVRRETDFMLFLFIY